MWYYDAYHHFLLNCICLSSFILVFIPSLNSFVIRLLKKSEVIDVGIAKYLYCMVIEKYPL